MKNTEYQMKTKEFSTSDLYFAAFLKAAQVTWLGAEKSDPRSNRMVFKFENVGHQIEELKQAFFSRSGESKVVALNYADEVQALKAYTRV